MEGGGIRRDQGRREEGGKVVKNGEAEKLRQESQKRRRRTYQLQEIYRLVAVIGRGVMIERGSRRTMMSGEQGSERKCNEEGRSSGRGEGGRSK